MANETSERVQKLAVMELMLFFARVLMIAGDQGREFILGTKGVGWYATITPNERRVQFTANAEDIHETLKRLLEHEDGQGIYVAAPESPDALCIVCDSVKGAPMHNATNPRGHDFEPPRKAPPIAFALKGQELEEQWTKERRIKLENRVLDAVERIANALESPRRVVPGDLPAFVEESKRALADKFDRGKEFERARVVAGIRGVDLIDHVSITPAERELLERIAKAIAAGTL